MSTPSDRSPPLEEDRTSTRVRSSSSPPSDTAVERLTDDLLVEILSRVPAKSICRFKCVSNHWLSLIDHPDHRKKLHQTLVGFFYGTSNTEDWLLKSPFHFASILNTRCCPVDISFGFLPNHRRIDVLDCCNVLVLCRWYDFSTRGDEFRYVVFNPATEKWVMFPDSGKARSQVVTTRLGFDPASSSHFHVFELVMDQVFFWDPDIVGVAVYSSETGRWVYKEKRWDAHIRLINRQSASVFLDGYLHFQAKGHERPPCLAIVDTAGETWMNFAVPDRGLCHGFIQQSQGRLYYANFQRYDDGSVIRLVVYVLENYESKEWILKHSVETSCLFGGIDYSLVEGIYYSKDGGFDWVAIHPECNMIFFTIGWENKLMCYSMDSRQVKMISKLVDGKTPYLSYVPQYAELQSLQI